MLISMQHLMYLVLSRQLFQTYNVHANAVVMKMLKFVIQNARKQKSEHKFSKNLDTWYLCWAKILIIDLICFHHICFHRRYLKSVSAFKSCTGWNSYFRDFSPSSAIVFLSFVQAVFLVLSKTSGFPSCSTSQLNVLAAIFVPWFRSKGDGFPPCCMCPNTFWRVENISLPSSWYNLKSN